MFGAGVVMLGVGVLGVATPTVWVVESTIAPQLVQYCLVPIVTAFVFLQFGQAIDGISA